MIPKNNAIRQIASRYTKVTVPARNSFKWQTLSIGLILQKSYPDGTLLLVSLSERSSVPVNTEANSTLQSCMPVRYAYF